MPRWQAPSEKRERPVVRVEHHLLRLARIGAHEHHAAVAEPDVGDLHRRRHAVHDDDLVAPIKLVGLARRKGQRNVGRRRRARMLLPPTDRVTTDGGVAAVKAKPLHLLENANQRQTLARRFLRIGLQRSLEPLAPRPKPRHRLPRPLVTKLRRPRPDDLPHYLARNPQLAADLLDRFALRKICPTYLGDRLHNQHPNRGPQQSWRPVWTRRHGVPIGRTSAP